MLMKTMTDGFAAQKTTLQCLENKICNVRGEIPVAVAASVEPVKSEIRKIHYAQKQQGEAQKRQDETLQKQGRDIAKLFSIVCGQSPSVPESSPASSSRAHGKPQQEVTREQAVPVE